jgi:hypothetical protein
MDVVIHQNHAYGVQMDIVIHLNHEYGNFDLKLAMHA